MKVLAIGINPSKQKGIPEGTEDFRSNSSSDKKLKEALTLLFGKDKEKWDTSNIINKKMSVNDFLNLSEEKQLELCEKNKPNLLNKIQEFKPNLILILFKPNKHYKVLIEFMNSLKEQERKFPKMIHINHPRYVSSYKKRQRSVKEYAKDIKNKIKEEKCEWCDGR